MTTKKCYKCQTSKSLEEFSRNKSRKDGLNNQCKKCQVEYGRCHYENNKATYLAQTKARKEKVRKWLADYKTTLACEKCGTNHPAVIDFHHKDGKQKEFDIATATYRKSINNILLEIKKCTVLCSNCHRILHWEERTNANLRQT